MNRFDNPFCLDPKVTSCPRLQELGFIFNRITGNLEPIEERPEPPEGFLRPQVEPRRSRRPTPLTDSLNKKDPRGSFPFPKEKRLKGLLAPDRFQTQPSPKDIERVRMMYPEYFGNLFGSWQNIYKNEEDGLLIWRDDSKKELRFVFRGAEEGQKGRDMLWNVFLGQDKKIQNSTLFEEYDTKISEYISDNPDYSYEFVGYSFGAYKARYFAGLYGGDQHLFNAHILPYSKLGQNGGTSYYHTVISDSTNFKYWLPVWNGELNVNRESSGEEIHTLYLPLKDVDPDIITGDHTSSHFTEVGERYVPHETGVSILSSAGMALGVAELATVSSGNQPSSALQISTDTVGTVQMAVDAPLYELADASASDTSYFFDRTGLTEWLKSDERKRQDEEINEEREFTRKVSRPPNQSLETWTDPATGIVYEEVP